MKKKPKKFKLKVGDKIWTKMPVNAKIIHVNQQHGYTIKVDGGTEYSFFTDKEVSKVVDSHKS